MRDATGLEFLINCEYLASVPEGETIVSMVVHDGQLFVATEKHVYQLLDNKRLEKLEQCQNFAPR